MTLKRTKNLWQIRKSTDSLTYQEQCFLISNDKFKAKPYLISKFFFKKTDTSDWSSVYFFLIKKLFGYSIEGLLGSNWYVTWVPYQKYGSLAWGLKGLGLFNYNDYFLGCDFPKVIIKIGWTCSCRLQVNKVIN